MNSKTDLEQELARTKRVVKKQLVFFSILAFILVSFFGFELTRRIAADRNLSREDFIHGLFRYPFLDPTRNLMEQKDAITNIQPLREQLKQVVAKEQGSARISLYFEVLNTGANISINQEEKVFPVSLAKLPVALLVIKKIEDGDWTIDQTFEASDENLNFQSGDLSQKVKPGDKVEIKRLLREMLIYSDNTAYRILKRNTTLEERQKLATEIGLGELFDDQGKISAKEYSRLLRTLYTASYLNQENSQMVLQLLSENSFRNYVSAGLPQEVVFSHKHGQNLQLNVYSDSGIVYLKNRPYIISIMIEPRFLQGGEGEKYAESIFKEVSEEAYQYMKNK